MSKPDIPDILANIFRRWDIGLIQEIRDATNTSAWQLLDLINKPSKDYGLVVSEREVFK